MLAACDGPLLCLCFRFVSLLMRSAHFRIVDDLSSPIVVAEADCPSAMASFVATPFARVVAIAYWPRCAAMAASCALLSASNCYVAVWFVAASAVVYCL